MGPYNANRQKFINVLFAKVTVELPIDRNWLLLINSIIFWLTPIALSINLAIAKSKPNSYKKKIGYVYGSIWAIAFLVYAVLFFTHS